MLRQILRPSLATATLAGVLASMVALGAGPEPSRALAVTLGAEHNADCRSRERPEIEPIRRALLARCIADSDEISNAAARDSRHDRAAIAPVATLGDGCGPAARPMPARHAVCYAAILPGGAAHGAGD
jgi:hypothetical protein